MLRIALICLGFLALILFLVMLAAIIKCAGYWDHIEEEQYLQMELAMHQKKEDESDSDSNINTSLGNE